jgi:hypothetical protein
LLDGLAGKLLTRIHNMIAEITAVAGLVIGGIGLFESNDAAQQQAQYQAQALALQKQEQKERRKAMELDARRRRREIIRQGVAARSLALTTATAQGAQFGSVLPGAYGGIEGRTGVNTLGVNQNQEIGGRIFDLKGQISDAYVNAAFAGSRAASGQALTSFGGMLLQNSQNLAKLGSSASAFLSG